MSNHRPNDAGFCSHEVDCPPAPDALQPRPLRWEARFPDVPADEASPYCGQLFAASEAAALEFVAYLADRRLITEWPEEQEQIATERDFDTWFSAWKAGLFRQQVLTLHSEPAGNLA